MEKKNWLNLIQDVSFIGCSQMKGAKKLPPPLKSVTHPTMMELDTTIPYLTKIHSISESRDRTLEFC